MRSALLLLFLISCTQQPVKRLQIGIMPNGQTQSEDNPYMYYRIWNDSTGKVYIETNN